ncbi:hypothetical protein AMJ49_06470 [Parcubacteria bacterium DG_74_2]|nr:MAG: hypothetical protein AMJ49_06470 [Parcubacteria bacterium DG_74_2]
MKKIYFIILIGGIICFGLSIACPIFAYDVQKLANVSVEGDFTLGPGKIEVFLDPGKTTSRTLLITNRLGKAMKFKVGIEDFEGSPTGQKAAVLLGEERGPYSLKDYLEPELAEFILAHGERMVLPIEISIPENAEPGGLYGSVLISTAPIEEVPEGEEGKAKGQVQIIGRIASLFFVKVKGAVTEEGVLEKFDTVNSKKLHQQGSISFSISYRNKGNIHLNPYGIIEIKNILGKKIDEIEIEPYFAMPNSLRLREMKWETRLSLGYYTATLSLNRGYQDIVDEATISFWIIPWKILLGAAIVIFLFLAFIRWAMTRFEIRRKP